MTASAWPPSATAWVDADGDGVQDPEEVGIQGVDSS